jgi:elongation factor P--(R)-beta-lysine ligase
MSPACKISILKDRAKMFEKARSFFSERNILEVDTPILSRTAPIDEHIDVMEVALKDTDMGYLHTSPEYAMKRLLSLGIGDIYQMGHVFRKNELGHLHNPEFTMAEWYRVDMAFEPFILETLDFIRLFLGDLPHRKMTYRDTLKHFTGLDYLPLGCEELLSYIESRGIEISSSKESLDKDALLTLITGFLVEPELGKDELFVLTDYPASQAALARTETKQGESVAKRFEIYFKGIELANGYHELTDAKEQRKRFQESNLKRASHGKQLLPIDEHLLRALEKGLPECCGVAVGIDRLIQLRHGTEKLCEVLPFGWEEM